MTQLHVGCGAEKFAGWINADIRREVEPDVVFDVRATWPFSDQTVSTVAAYHVIEHLDRHEGRHFLSEAHRVLEVGGILVLELPDLSEVVRQIAAGELGGKETHGDYLRLCNLFGAQRNAFDYHKWGYTAETLAELVTESGFDVIYRGPGTDYHAQAEPCQRMEARRR